MMRNVTDYQGNRYMQNPQTLNQSPTSTQDLRPSQHPNYNNTHTRIHRSPLSLQPKLKSEGMPLTPTLAPRQHGFGVRLHAGT